jgi:hypothetical protein
MDNFVQISKTLINTQRLVVVSPRPTASDGSFLAVWDTGQDLVLTQQDGEALIKAIQRRDTKPPDGTIAMTSDRAI